MKTKPHFFSQKRPLFHFILAAFILFTSGCATHTRIKNIALDSQNIKTNYHDKYSDTSRLGDIFLALSFSGGGTRAAAFSYGVLSELRDTTIDVDGRRIRLLDELDHISSVSGGSFTAAYYGLFGDRIFDNFETVFLRQNIQKTLINSVLNPINWFNLLKSGFDRTSIAVAYYDKYIFQGKTFGDMTYQTSPFIQINATDLATGQSFGFTQESFDFLCSDLSKFKISRAVAASSAVPIVFPPITLKNYAGCTTNELKVLRSIKNDPARDIRLQTLANDILSYTDKERRKYIHLVDGGISDNLGIRAMVYRLLLLNEVNKESESIKADSTKLPKNIVVIVVNAETSRTKKMEQSPDAPSAAQVMRAVSSAQISRYNLETISQAKELFNHAAVDISSKGPPVNMHFIELKFDDIQDLAARKFFNNMSTSFSLPDEQVDMLYESGRQLLRNSKVFQDFLQGLGRAEK